MTKLYKGEKHAEAGGVIWSGDLGNCFDFVYVWYGAPYRATYMFIESLSNKLNGRPRACCMWVLTPCLHLDVGRLLNSFHDLSSPLETLLKVILKSVASNGYLFRNTYLV